MPTDIVAVIVDETLQHVQTLKEAQWQRILQAADPTDPEKDWMDGEKEFYQAIVDTVTGQIQSSIDFMDDSEEMKKLTEGNFKGTDEQLNLINDFNKALDNHLDELIYQSAPTFQGYMQKFYTAGKAEEFNEMDVKEYTSAIDSYAQYTIANYDFGLIQRVSDDLRMQIKDEIWRGTAQGETLKQLKSRIEDTGIQPIRSGWTGKMLTVDQRSTLIARTESMRALNQGHIIAYQQYGVEKVDVITAEDEKVCADCEDAEENGPYPIDNIPDDAQLPEHPGCRCTYAAADEVADEPSDVSVDDYVDLTEQNT